MTTRDEIDRAMSDLIDAARGREILRGDSPGWQAIADDAIDAACDRIRALLSPARLDGDVTTEMVEAAGRELANWGIWDEQGPWDYTESTADAFNEVGRAVLNAALAAAHDRPGGED